MLHAYFRCILAWNVQRLICRRMESVLLLFRVNLSPFHFSLMCVVSATSRTRPWGRPAFLPFFNLCVQNQKTWTLQVSRHIPVFPRALMENGGMEWEEIYGTNPSRVLKTLASDAATSSSFSPLACSPLLLQPKPREREMGQPIGASPKAEHHITFGQICSAAAAHYRQRGHHWHLVADPSWARFLKWQPEQTRLYIYLLLFYVLVWIGYDIRNWNANFVLK